jgi:DNA invertase Pin-like site-specific DNA recombinase
MQECFLGQAATPAQAGGGLIMALRCGVYARVSTHEQSCESQLLELREYASRRGWVVTREFVDTGWSGAKERRPELDRLTADCRRRRLDVVLVYRFDRFARSVRQLVLALEEFRSLKIDFVSIHEGCDTSTPNGRLVFNIFASIAEFERELIRDRVRSGLAAARKRGTRLGRPQSAVDVGRIHTLRAAGTPWRVLAKQLGLSVNTVRKAALIAA